MGIFTDRTGEINYNNKDEKMTIIAYRNSNDIDIQFEDGSIVYNKKYSAFQNGLIKHPIRYEESFAYYIEVELGLNLDDIWNWEKNKVNPNEITKCSGKKVWLYCLEHDYHNYDRENNKIGYEIVCNDFYRGKRCGYCNIRKKVHWKDSLAYKYPQIAKMIAIEENDLTFEDCYNISCSTHKEFYFKCLDCNNVSKDKRPLNNIVKRRKYSCQYCSDGFSIPSKFMINILKQLDINFKTELSSKKFYSKNLYYYDFYLSKYNMIIEVNGEQHYIESGRGRSLKEERANDRYKKHLAKSNGIKRYYSIDCKYSDFKYMKNNIIKTLGHLFDLSNIDWELAWEESQNSLCVKSWELWNKKLSITDISNKLNLHKDTVKKYLKIGNECGKCNYR